MLVFLFVAEAVALKHWCWTANITHWTHTHKKTRKTTNKGQQTYSRY